MSLLNSPPAWTVLDTCFGSGEGLVAYLKVWRASGQRKGLLHYVAICESASKPNPQAEALDTELGGVLAGALPGFQRFLLADGQVHLTLCMGSVRQMLSEQQFQADEVHLSADLQTWDKWLIQLLARRCRRGTVVKAHTAAEQARAPEAFKQALAAQGFAWQSPDIATYNPAWELRNTRNPRAGARPSPARCAVIGGGLSGAAVACAMARRGWQVTVLDTRAQCAAGASSLPVGLVVPHVSVDDSPRSRLSRVGLSLTLQYARRLLRRGEDWDDTGVLELTQDAQRRLDASPSLRKAGWLEPGGSQLRPQPWAAGLNWDHSLWHPRAGWIKPASLVQAWLATPGIQWRGHSPVHRLECNGGVWSLHQTNDDTLAQAELVVVANAMGAAPLLEGHSAAWLTPEPLRHQLCALQALHGTVSHGSVATPQHGMFPPFPVNGSGSLVSLRTHNGQEWYAGASYERDAALLTATAQQHASNLQRLQGLLPAVSESVSGDFSTGSVGGWTGTRCVSNDRLPLVGSVDGDGTSGLWICAAMGSRGLSFAALCAELLAARVGNEPLPVEARLARSLDAQRPIRGKH